jgi:hypothetical protein
MARPVIFLDMDGVLCTPRAALALGDHGLLAVLDPVSVAILNMLVRRSRAHVVMSSTWRLGHDRHSMECILRAGGCRFHLHEDWRTTNIQQTSQQWINQRRGMEVDEWLSRHPEVPSYLILDDDSDFSDAQKERLVLTSGEDGILWEHWMRAMDLLGIEGIVDRETEEAEDAA